MARFEAPVTQRDFSLGEVRPEFLEADDDEIRAKSVRRARNVRPVAGKILKNRPGTFKIATLDAATLDKCKEIEPLEGQRFLLVFGTGRLDIYNVSGVLVQSFTGAPWTTIPWIVPFHENTLIGTGTSEMHVLSYDGTTWLLGAMAFADASGGALAQPYHSFNKSVSLTPSALSGTGITLTASSAVFTSAYVGLRLRYHGKEILITGYTSATVLVGDVVSELPPSFDVTVANASGFEAGEVVVGATSNFSGYVVGVNTTTNVLQIVTLTHFEGPDTSPVEDLAGPNTVSAVVSVAAAVSPYASINWEEPLISSIRGYPRSATTVTGRLALCDFSGSPDMLVLSSVRGFNDFETGLDDGDAIQTTVGDGAQRIRHVVDAGDLLILADEGCYFVLARDGVKVTPNNFSPVRFDMRGVTSSSNGVTPIVVGYSVIFVSATGEDILAAVLDGSVYLRWTVVVVSRNHSHLVVSPISLSAPPQSMPFDDRMVLYVNSDETTVAITWNDSINGAGFFPWENLTTPTVMIPPNTKQIIGGFKDITTFGGQFWGITERNFDGGTSQKFLEQIAPEAWMDHSENHSGGSTPSLSYYNGAPISVRIDDNFIGTYATYAEVEGVIAAGSSSDVYQIGVAWETWVSPWPVEYINSPRLGMIRSRTIRVAVSVANTISFKIRRNNTTNRVQAYSFGDDLSLPPPRKTHVYRFPVYGNRDHPFIEIGKDIPGPFELLAYTAEVQA